MSRNILIVFAHPEHGSFNGELLRVAKETLASEGHTVEISDLYKMEFNPVISRSDIKGNVENPEKFDWLTEIQKAYAQNRTADDIQSEQRKLDAADLVIFQFPLYWFGFPAILKGWVDRVMHMGYATKWNETYEDAHFKGKRAMLSFTTGGSEEAFSNRGRNGDMDVVLWSPQNGFLRYVGFDVLAPNWIANVYRTDTHQEQLDAWSTRLKCIFDEKPLHFLPHSKFQEQQLTNDDVEGEYGPTVGQHCGLKLPPGSQTQNNYRWTTFL